MIMNSLRSPICSRQSALGNRQWLWLLLPCLGSGCAHPARQPAPVDQAVAFLSQEVPAWSVENGCYSCHHNGVAAQALLAAARAGYPVRPATLSDTLAWVAKPAQWDKNQGDPGFSDQRLANLQFAATLLAATAAGRPPEAGALAAAAKRVAADQNPSGSWEIEPANPIGSPTTYGTALATVVGLTILERAGRADAVADKTLRWLMERPLGNVPTAASMLLATRSESYQGPQPPSDSLAFLLQAQHSDGGWGPYLDAPSEPFDTALALLALATFGSRPAVERSIDRGRAFLQAAQLPDGSWRPLTPARGGESYAQHVATTGWATLALLETAP